ncbi:MAG: thioredoxin family protein [archaeon]|nr:thioredoxin family protein [archaeon]MDA0842675.1 thioredoxin family protein [archaeon]
MFVHKHFLMFGLTLMLCSISAQGIVVELNETFDQPVSSTLGGRSLVVEELTATWCEVCAEVDPYLVNVADSHGSRIILLALHPSDDVDAFQPEAAKDRIDRRMVTHPDLGSTPTFIVEGGEMRIGYDAWGEVQNDILEKELGRTDVSSLEFEVVKENSNLIAKVKNIDLSQSTGQLTFLYVEHEKVVPDGAINPGKSTRDRVVVGLSECNIETNSITKSIGLSSSVSDDCLSSFEVEFEPQDSWSIVLIHEPTLDEVMNGTPNESYGAIELSYRERGDNPQSNSMLFAILFLAVGISMTMIPNFRKSSLK